MIRLESDKKGLWISRTSVGFLPMPMGLFRHISLYIIDYTLLPKYESKLVRKSWQISEWFDGQTDIVIKRTFESLTFQHFFHEPTFHSVFYKLILCYFSVAIRVHSFPGQKCTVDMLWSRISLAGVMRFLNPVLLSKLTIQNFVIERHPNAFTYTYI